MLWKPKKTIEHQDVSFGVCVWQLPDGSYVKNEYDEYFCAQGKIGDERMEKRMADAVRGLGVTSGMPVWFPGFRKITQSEWEDQMDMLQSGQVPDPVDLYRQVENGS